MTRAAGTVSAVALSALTLAVGVGGADARGLRLRGHNHSTQPRPQPSSTATVRSVPTIAAVGEIGVFEPKRDGTDLITRSVVAAGSQGADETTPIPPMPPAPVAVQKPAEPWCRSGRVAGRGDGFCLIN